MHSRTHTGPLAALVLAVMLACTARPSNAATDRAGFAAHLGAANFCFHHWVSGPYRAGKFVANAPHRTASIVKAGSALLYAARELKAAHSVAQASKDSAVHKLGGLVTDMKNAYESVGARFKAGKYSSADIDTLNGAYSATDSGARAAKIDVKDVPVTLP